MIEQPPNNALKLTRHGFATSLAAQTLYWPDEGRLR
jgi:hypothetical protein